MAAKYIHGERVRLSVTFKDPAGSAADPPVGTIHIQYCGPDNVIVDKIYNTDAEVVRDGVGLYHIDVLADQVGVWEFRWSTDDPGNETASEGAFTVQASKFV